MSFAFRVLTASQELPLHQDVVQLLVCTFGRPVCNLLFRCFLYIMLSATNFCNINHSFNQSPLRFDSLRVCGPTLRRSIPIPGRSSALKCPPTICMFFVDLINFSIELYAFSKRWSAKPEWGKYTLINVIRCLLTVIVAMARSLVYSVKFILFHYFLFKSIATPCLFSSFPAPMRMGPWRDSHISALFGLHVSESKRASHLRFCHLSSATLYSSEARRM